MYFPVHSFIISVIHFFSSVTRYSLLIIRMEVTSYTATVKKFFCTFDKNEKLDQAEEDIQNMKNDDVEQFLLREYECPVCINYAVPPILMCMSSHIICFSCWKRCPKCPTCRTEKTATRAFALEKIYPILTFPCKYSSCPFAGNDGLTVEHQRNCDYVPLKCPFEENFQCHWSGAYREAKDHLTEYHSDNVYFDSSAVLINRRFKNSPENRFVLVFYAYGNIFQLKWEYNFQRPVVKFNIKNLGYRQDDPDTYTYEVIFTNNQKRRLKSFMMSGNIPSVFSADTGDFNALLSELLYTYSKKNETLAYKVSIYRHSPKVRMAGKLL